MSGFFDDLDVVDISRPIGFCRGELNRHEELRADAAAIAERLANPRARFLLFCQDRPVIDLSGEALTADHDRAKIVDFRGNIETAIYLGDDGDAPWFAVNVLADADMVDEIGTFKVIDLRSLAMQDALPAEVLSALALAKSLTDWHHRHGFCANCGHHTNPVLAGWRRDCPSCGAEHFPRTDPVVIMLTIDGDHCLLGRQAKFSPGLYSALAGFVEPGETIEAAVRREIAEEAGIAVGRVRYHTSQPWPFPSSLMIGCFAEALSREITVNEEELDDARWFTREEAHAMLDARDHATRIVPRPIAIAYWLLLAWLEA
ncbi:MAG: NAD(+) diphosphatase [Hyphomicrobiales bacterium]|nr:NAD(+) diphosphatase [Hyphomicrobiales bacterium]